jgi:hypothetical protein
MIALFAKTWFLWWLLASVVILRWFHAVAVVDPSDAQDRPKRDKHEHAIPVRWLLAPNESFGIGLKK